MALPGLRLVGATTAAYQIGRSLRFRSTANAYLSRTPSASNRKTWTWSGWVKRGAFGSALSTLFMVRGSDTDATFFRIAFSVSVQDALLVSTFNATTVGLETTALFRDPSSWYHITFAFDTTQATASNRMRLYVNGVQITSFGTANYPTLNADYGINAASPHHLGLQEGSTNYYYEGYMADVYFIDGQALTPSAFGQTDPSTGAWVPRRYSGTYGTNGFYLPFNDTTSTTTLAQDRSGNANNFTATNISLTAGVTYDSSLDTPTKNWCTFNALSNLNNGVPFNGLLSSTATVNTTPTLLCASMGVRTGKWYWEFTPSASGSFGYYGFFDTSISSFATSPGYTGGYTGSVGIEMGSAICYSSNASAGTLTSGAFTAGQTLCIALDMDNGRVFFGKNGTWENSGDPAAGTNPRVTGLTGEKVPSISNYSGNGTCDANFGQRPFGYTVPTGFLPINAANLAAPSIRRGDNFFQAVTYTGTGSSLGVTGTRFTPDLVWIKSRSAATDHALYDAVRGTQARLESNTTDAEVTADAGLTAFNSNGFTVNTLAQVNTNTATYAAWAWDEAVSAGIDIVTYTGDGTTPRSINHGLGVSPAMVIVKSRSTASTQWPVFHQNLTAGNNMFLNLTDAQQSATGVANGGITAVSSTTFTVANGTVNGNNVNTNTTTYVAYLFSEVAGFSRIRTYTGNGVADGPFAWCGFRPRFVMIKRTDTGNANTSWIMHDAARSPSNGVVGIIRADLNSAEVNTSIVYVDFLSNGFKVRIAADDAHNQSGGTYAFAAFAEVPFKYANAR